MKTSDFGYILPKELIAQEPCAKRDACRLLSLDKSTGQIEDLKFFEIEKLLKPGDLLVANETRVLPARLIGTKRGTEGEAELLLLRNLAETHDANTWEALVKPGRRLKPASVSEKQNTTRSVSCGEKGPVVDFVNEIGEIVLSAEVID